MLSLLFCTCHDTLVPTNDTLVNPLTFLFSPLIYQEAIREERKRHDAHVQEIRDRHKTSTDSLTSRFNDTLKLKDKSEARVKVLALEVERLAPVRRITNTTCPSAA